MSRAVSPKIAKEIWMRDEGICVYCGSPASALDHVIPYSKKGITAKNNLVCACIRCNSKKHNKLDQDFITRGIFYLLQQGENMDWVDKL